MAEGAGDYHAAPAGKPRSSELVVVGAGGGGSTWLIAVVRLCLGEGIPGALLYCWGGWCSLVLPQLVCHAKLLVGWGVAMVGEGGSSWYAVAAVRP